MNKDLEGIIFDIPEYIIGHITNSTNLYPNETEGIMRANNLIQSKQVNYGQLKRILHDIKNLDKTIEVGKYNLYGGNPMESWGWSVLNGQRDLIQANKKGTERAINIGAIDGMKENPHNKTHKRKSDSLVKLNLNPLKSNSSSSPVSSLTMGKLFEEITKIKKLMN